MNDGGPAEGDVIDRDVEHLDADDIVGDYDPGWYVTVTREHPMGPRHRIEAGPYDSEREATRAHQALQAGREPDVGYPAEEGS